MLKTLSAIAIAASLIAGPALAQNTSPAPATQETQASVPTPKAKVAVQKKHKAVAHKKIVKKHAVKKHMTKKHVAKKHVAKKHLAKKHAVKKHIAKKRVKHLKAAI